MLSVVFPKDDPQNDIYPSCPTCHSIGALGCDTDECTGVICVDTEPCESNKGTLCAKCSGLFCVKCAKYMIEFNTLKYCENCAPEGE